jgi:hypothetical protein
MLTVRTQSLHTVCREVDRSSASFQTILDWDSFIWVETCGSTRIMHYGTTAKISRHLSELGGPGNDCIYIYGTIPSFFFACPEFNNPIHHLFIYSFPWIPQKFQQKRTHTEHNNPEVVVSPFQMRDIKVYSFSYWLKEDPAELLNVSWFCL